MRRSNVQREALLDQLDVSRLGASAAFREWVAEPTFTASIPVELVERVEQDTGLRGSRLMLSLLPFAAVFADARVSRYAAACVARGMSGGMYFGANAEFPPASLSLTIHAEQAATLNAWEHHETALTHMAISAAPCGQCRQFLYEINQSSKLMVALPKTPSRRLLDLLPAAFGPQDLGIEACLMSRQTHELEVAMPRSADRLLSAAHSAAATSYAPYSGAFAAVGLETESGEIYTGRYAENAAFNPSVPPVTAALTRLRLGGESPENIKRALLVEQATKIHHAEITKLVLETVSRVSLEVHSSPARSSIAV